MWCGPDAVAHLTGWTREQAWLHIRALREQSGYRLTDTPRSGTCTQEILDCLHRAGYVTEEAWTGRRRMRYGLFRRTIAKTGTWLCLQRRHFFAFDVTRNPVRYPEAIILRAWRVRRKRKGEQDVQTQA